MATLTRQPLNVEVKNNGKLAMQRRQGYLVGGAPGLAVVKVSNTNSYRADGRCGQPWLVYHRRSGAILHDEPLSRQKLAVQFALACQKIAQRAGLGQEFWMQSQTDIEKVAYKKGIPEKIHRAFEGIAKN